MNECKLNTTVPAAFSVFCYVVPLFIVLLTDSDEELERFCNRFVIEMEEVNAAPLSLFVFISPLLWLLLMMIVDVVVE